MRGVAAQSEAGTAEAGDREEAVAVAAQVSLAVAAKASAENFPVALRVLPKRWRAHLTALYGFARLTDDIGDEPLPGLPRRRDRRRRSPRPASSSSTSCKATWRGSTTTRPRAGPASHQGPQAHGQGLRDPGAAVLRPHPGQPPGPARHQVRHLPGACGLLQAVREPGRPGGPLHHGGGDAGAHRGLGQHLHCPAGHRAHPGRRRGPRQRPDLPAAAGHGRATR